MFVRKALEAPEQGPIQTQGGLPGDPDPGPVHLDDLLREKAPEDVQPVAQVLPGPRVSLVPPEEGAEPIPGDVPLVEDRQGQGLQLAEGKMHRLSVQDDAGQAEQSHV